MAVKIYTDAEGFLEHGPTAEESAQGESISSLREDRTDFVVPHYTAYISVSDSHSRVWTDWITVVMRSKTMHNNVQAATRTCGK